MADPPSSPATQQPEPDNPKRVPTPSTPPPPSTSAIPQQQQSATPLDPNQNPNPNPNSTPIPNPAPLVPPPTSISPYPLPAQPMSAASLPSFRPVPQFAPLPNYQNPSVGVPPPGVTAVPAAGSVSVPPPVPFLPYPLPPGQQPNPALRPPFAPLPNGYPVPQGTIPPPGIARYPAPYPAMARPIFPPRPPGAPGLLPVAPRPLLPGIPGVRPVISPIRPAVPSVRPAEKPQTTVYVGKIAPTVEDDFMLSVLQLCGPVKSWKRAPNRGFGFCEFESAEGVLRSLRLLSKFNIDAQELMLNVDKATREYLERYVEKKKENAKNLDAQAVGDGTEEGSNSTVQKSEPLKASTDDASNDGETENKEDNNEAANFGIVTDEDKQGDREALDKLYSLREERLKTRPLPPPPPPPQAPADSSANSNTELPAKSKADSDGNATKNDEAEEKNDENRTTNEQERLESLSPDRNRRHDRRSRDRERDVKREKEREIERLEREAERERVRKEREQRRKIEEAEREYEERLKDWEYREREKEKQRQYEKEKEKERERKRRKEIIHDEEDEDDDSRKRWRRNTLEEKRRKRLREKEEDIEDRLKEEEEIAEAQRRAEEEMLQKQQRDALKVPSDNAMNGSEKPVMVKEADENIKEMVIEQASEFGYGKENHRGDVALQNGNVDEHEASKAESDVQHSNNALTKKLGFGLVGSGKRAAFPSVFNEEDDDEANKDKKMRPLVPIDYSMEELQAVQQQVPGVAAPNLIAAAEYAKRISSSNPKEEKSNMKRDRSKYSHDRSSRRDRDRKDEDVSRSWDEKKEKNTEQERDRENRSEKVKTPDTQRLLDAKQLIDMIPKTKEELFSYEINWAIYDKNQLQERMRPWISKKITEFLGEEETTLVDFIVSSTSEHVKASEMLEMLQSILDEEAEMFVLKMWRMLIFEIKKVETGLHLRSKS